MLLHILLWYVVISYIVGFSLYIIDVSIMMVNRSRAIKAQAHTGMNFSRYINVGGALKIGTIAMLLSPLTAWHVVLHYAATIWYKAQGKPVKYWL